jgi:DNA-binding protein HU-beta
MNKQELFENVASELNTSKAQGEKIVNAVFKSIQTGLKKDKTVQLVGFGTFNVRSRKARIGRNPQTGAEIKIKPSRTVGFKAGKSQKESV